MYNNTDQKRVSKFSDTIPNRKRVKSSGLRFCRHDERDLEPLIEYRKNYPFGRKSTPRFSIKGIWAYRCKHCGDVIPNKPAQKAKWEEKERKIKEEFEKANKNAIQANELKGGSYKK
jgi:hypothetical protein